MQKLVFNNDKFLEKNVVAVVKQIAKDNGIHLKSKYSKDCELSVEVLSPFANIEDCEVELEISRVDGKAVNNHSFHVSLQYDDSDNEYVVLDARFFGSMQKNEIVNLLPVEHSNYAGLITSSEKTQVPEIVALKNKQADEARQKAWEKDQQLRDSYRSFESHFSDEFIADFEDKYDLPFDRDNYELMQSK
ncbi:hypothetical protein HCC36_11105 [Listeria booriae]|uniref:Uncharacterized protein n=1 Tax=Listeria booriae TaxID=1552123 RepID=A0A842GBU2_9LIST|nr:hypothetical protein [Listeria booriae]MBC2293777.1 hypothetical protein [Listeria booriae]